MCFHWNLPFSQCQSSPLYLSFVLHALEKDTRILNLKPSLLKVKLFGGVSDFSYSWFSDLHILCFASHLWYSKFQFLVVFTAVSRKYIAFIQTKILISPLENHYINWRLRCNKGLSDRNSSNVTSRLPNEQSTGNHFEKYHHIPYKKQKLFCIYFFTYIVYFQR